jgi:serine protease Do
MRQPLGRNVLFAACLLVVLGVWPVLFNQLSQALPGTSGTDLTLVPHPAFAHSSAGGPQTIADVAEHAVKGVVNVSTGGQRGGSGVIVSPDGVVVTNNHVVDNAESISVTTADGQRYAARIVGGDAESDLAVLRLQGVQGGTLTALTMGNSSSLRLGEVVLAIGNPFGVGQTVTMGIVSAKDRRGFVQTDAAINPGNSGGALVNMRGELVGINTIILSRTGANNGIGFAIPSNTARPLVGELLRDGRIKRAWLGVSIQTVTADLAEAMNLGTDRGVFVAGVVPGSPADAAGIAAGDIIVGAHDAEVSTPGQLQQAVVAAGIGTQVRIDLVRNRRKRSLMVVLSERGLAAATPQQPAAAPPLTHGGLRVEPLTDRTRSYFGLSSRIKRGVVVAAVEPGSAADEAGLIEGDVITEVNGIPLDDPQQFAAAARKSPERTLVRLDRGGKQVYLLLRH